MAAEKRKSEERDKVGEEGSVPCEEVIHLETGSSLTHSSLIVNCYLGVKSLQTSCLNNTTKKLDMLIWIPRVNGAMVLSEDRMHSQEFEFTLQTTRS